MRFCPLDSKNVFVLVLAHLEPELELFGSLDVGSLDNSARNHHHHHCQCHQLQYHTVHLIGGPIQVNLDLFWILILRDYLRTLWQSFDHSSWHIIVLDNTCVFQFACFLYYLPKDGLGHIFPTTCGIWIKACHAQRPALGPAQNIIISHHHHIIMLKLSSSSHHHVKIIITIMIIIMSSRQKASRATISNSMFVMLAPIYPNHKEISWKWLRLRTCFLQVITKFWVS